KRVPDDAATVVQAGQPAAGRDLADAGGGLGQVQREALLLERDAENLHQHPCPQRPRRVVLVADVERIAHKGTVFPGFMMLSGSSARLTARMRSTASPCSSASTSSLCQPM